VALLLQTFKDERKQVRLLWWCCGPYSGGPSEVECLKLTLDDGFGIQVRRSVCALTFDVRGTRRRRRCGRSEQACPAVVCPLDGRVSRIVVDAHDHGKLR
jgi:hypothetical protein